MGRVHNLVFRMPVAQFLKTVRYEEPRELDIRSGTASMGPYGGEVSRDAIRKAEGRAKCQDRRAESGSCLLADSRRVIQSQEI